MPDLNEDGLPVHVDGVEIVTPGLRGVVTLRPVPATGTRGPEDDATDAFAEAAATVGLERDLTIEIRDHREVDSSGGSRAAGADDIEVTVPGPGEGWGQVLLYSAEDGSLSWHLPVDLAPEQVAVRGPARLTYRVPRAIVPAEDGPTHRGILGTLGRKVLEVLSFRLIDRVAGATANWFVSRYEERHRPHRLRAFDPDTYGQTGRELSPRDWDLLGSGRALLFVHGTASTTRNAFGRIPRDLVTHLHSVYGRRVFAFDHPTLSADPRENVRALAKALPDGIRLDLDILAHSRGGLVGRLLAERPADFGLQGRLEVGRLVMVATPNAGTALADRAHLSSLVDRFTNLLQFVPADGATDVLEVVLSLLKQVAVGALGGLDGLMSMDPRGDFLTAHLNDPAATTTARYLAVAADFEPSPGSPLGRRFRDAATDLVFGKAGNDLVVPTAGVYAAPPAGTFPVAGPVLFGSGEHVHHSGYWDRQVFVTAARSWLTG